MLRHQNTIKTQKLRRAKRDGDVHAIEEIMEKLLPLTDLPLHHSSGFLDTYSIASDLHG